MTNITTNTSIDMFEMMEKSYKIAEIMAKSDIIPVHYRNKAPNVFIAIQSAYRMNIDPMLVMQNTFVVSGKLGMNTTFAISLANYSGLLDSGIKYRESGSGESFKVTAYANLKKTQEEISYTISMQQAKAEGWTKNSKYQTLPELMLRYRAATFLIRTHMPEVLNGMHMVEEIEDVIAATTKDIMPVVNTQKLGLFAKLDQFAEEQKESESKQLGENIEVPITTDIAAKEEISAPVSSVVERKKNDSDTMLELLNLVFTRNITAETTARWCAKFKVDDLQELTDEECQKCINHIHKDKTQIND